MLNAQIRIARAIRERVLIASVRVSERAQLTYAQSYLITLVWSCRRSSRT